MTSGSLATTAGLSMSRFSWFWLPLTAGASFAMASELVISLIFLLEGIATLLVLDGFLAAMIVRQIIGIHSPKDYLHRGLRRRPSMLEHRTKGLQQHGLNRH